MKTIPRRNTLRASRIPLVLSACAAASGFVIAAEPTADTEITVSAERPTGTVTGHTSSGGQIVLYEVSYRLSYGDLDLATSAGADELLVRLCPGAASSRPGAAHPVVPGVARGGPRCTGPSSSL